MSTSTCEKISINQCPCCMNEEIFCNHISNNKRLFNCINCGVYFFVDNPTLEELENHYTTTYSNVHENQLYKLLKENYDSGFLKKQVNDCLSYLNKEKNNLKVLDYGSSYGFFLKAAKDLGLDAYGMEYDRKISGYNEKELEIKMIPPDKLDEISDETFDIIRANHTIEHLSDPRKILSKLFNKLRKDGIIVISSPNFSDKIIRTNTLRLTDFVYPEHLFYFTKRSMEEILKQVGFDIEISITQFANNQQALRLLGIKHDYETNNVNKLCNILESDPFFSGANLFIVARKPRKSYVQHSIVSDNVISTYTLEQYFQINSANEKMMKVSDDGVFLINLKENGKWEIRFPINVQNSPKTKIFVSGNVLIFEPTDIHIKLLNEKEEILNNGSLIVRDNMLNSILFMHDLEYSFCTISFSGYANTKFLIYDLIATGITTNSF